MIELTDEMRAAVKRRMGIPQEDELDPWMGPAIEDVLAIVERDYTIRPRRSGAGDASANRDEIVACRNSTHHRGHRWVQLPGTWRECPGVAATDVGTEPTNP